MSETYIPQRASEASLEEDNVGYSARRMATTERGTEITPSNTGNRIIEAATRIAEFFDRFKGARMEASEYTQDKIEAGRAFLSTTGEKAIDALVATGEFTIGIAALGVETAERGATKVGDAIEYGAQTLSFKAEMTTNDLIGAAQLGLENTKLDAQDAVANVKEGLTNRWEMMKAKWADRRFEASMRKKVRHETWAARWEGAKAVASELTTIGEEKYAAAISAAERRRDSVLSTVDTALTRGQELFNDNVESVKKRVDATRKAGRAALAAYSSAPTELFH